MKVVTVHSDDGETSYKIAPIKAGQMRILTETRLKNPDLPYMQDNILCVSFCLTNAAQWEHAKGNGNGNCTEWTPEMVEDLPFPDYRLLLDQVNELNGFKERDQGEARATGIPASAS